ncbi:MAG: alanine racemase [Rickettsiales bacterium]|nr:alanine racemase [Rickettsiales bacterium]
MMQTFDGPQLKVYLDKVIANYQILSKQFSGQECGAVIKANSYGLGMEQVSDALATAECNTFFVATLEEGIQLRQYRPNRRIVVFHGVGPGEALAFVNHKLIPVLNSPEQIERWVEVSKEHPDARSVLHVDTAMGRLGLSQAEWEALDADIIEKAQVSLLMSHLACAGDPEHPSNAMQLELFEKARAIFSGIPCSFANSSGVFLDKPWHFDLARPGCSLYGITPHESKPNPMHNVVELSCPILQIRTLDRDQNVGYGATKHCKKGTRVATVAGGYADGIPRLLSNQLHGYLGEVRVPLVGRVTMDMLCFDVSAVPEGQLNEAERIVLIDERQTVDDIARMTDTIGYEVLCRLGRRIRRVYEGAPS